MLCRAGEGFGAVALAGMLQGAEARSACSEAAAFAGQSQERHLSLHARRREPRRHIRSEARTDPAQRPAALGRTGEDHQDQLHPRSDQGHSARQPMAVPSRRQMCGTPVSDLFPHVRETHGRHRRDARLLRRRLRSRSGHLSAQHRLAIPRPSLPGLVGHLRPGHGESESARVRRDVGRLHQVRTSGLQRGLSARGLPGHDFPRRRQSDPVSRKSRRRLERGAAGDARFHRQAGPYRGANAPWRFHARGPHRLL